MAKSLPKLVKKMFDIDLYDYQLHFLLDCMNNKRVLGAFCRQTGKSLTISILAVIEALKNPNGHIIIVAPTDRQAGELFHKVRSFLLNAPIRTEMTSHTQRSILMKNNCRIDAYPCGDNGDTIRGMTADVLIIEEAAFIKDTIVNQVLIPMVASTNGKIIKISTPKGMNHFYKSYQEDPLYKVHHYGWQYAVRANHFTKTFIDEQKRNLVSTEFKVEYESEFIADEDAYFPYALVNSVVDSELVLLDETKLIKIPGKEYVLGVDCARLGEDSSVFIIIEKGEPNRIVFMKELPKNTMDEAMDYILFLDKFMEFQKIVIDQTGLGAGLSDMLKRQYNKPKKNPSQTNYSNIPEHTDKIIGLDFTIKSKQDIFSNLKLLMESHLLLIPNHKKLVFQLKDFRYEITPSGNLKLHHSEGGRDDYPDSLACACHALRLESNTQDSFSLEF